MNENNIKLIFANDADEEYTINITNVTGKLMVDTEDAECSETEIDEKTVFIVEERGEYIMTFSEDEYIIKQITTVTRYDANIKQLMISISCNFQQIKEVY